MANVSTQLSALIQTQVKRLLNKIFHKCPVEINLLQNLSIVVQRLLPCKVVIVKGTVLYRLD